MMKKIVLLLLTLFLLLRGFSQAELRKAIHNYYRYDPFERAFSSFINNLLSDAALTNKTVVKRTDTTLFFFMGDYKGHHPFGFRESRTEVRLAETIIQSPDSIPKIDTILAYQILGYTARTVTGMESVKAEFSRFDRKYGTAFFNKATRDLVDGNMVEGMTCNYFLENTDISPLTITWGNVSATESVFAITVRLVKIENQAVLATANSQHTYR